MTHIPRKVLLLGSSALKIGEAGEFDYAGSQAVKALKVEHVQTILVNPNIATIQTSEDMADEVYFVPVLPEFVSRVIEQERPDGILLSFGGQTALNCGIELWRSGVLHKYGVPVLGTPPETVVDTEDRERFVKRMSEIGVRVPRSRSTANVAEALSAAEEIGYPCMARIAFALGGLGSGVCRDVIALTELLSRAFVHADQVLIEECLTGWKEIEYEVVRDCADNCITVCNMENLHPMGIHTGESIVIAPSQTLTDGEYHLLREVSIRVARHLGIVGECNVQFALSPTGDGYRVIEVNARLSRSSALASKATGYPLAKVAAQLSLGKTLTEIQNSVTRSTCACFEPALDYVIVKVPRWDLEKFRSVSRTIGSSMKSVGEVMAIGRNFEEALQKALRMLEIGAQGLDDNSVPPDVDIPTALANPTESHIFVVARALRDGMSVIDVCRLTRIDRWFIDRIANIVQMESTLREWRGVPLSESVLRQSKMLGFSDVQIAGLMRQTPQAITALRHELGVRPVVKQIDTLAAEYPAATNYLYLTYSGIENDVLPEPGSVMILGPGAYRIGNSVEFDWCCVTAAKTLRALGQKTLMINYNPETVSTDYDEYDRLYFEELSIETIGEIYSFESPLGIILSVGGQIPNNLAMACDEMGMNVIGTAPQDIDRAEHRHLFSQLLEDLGVAQPSWRELTSLEDVKVFAQDVGYPVIVRPSYVLSGAAMAVAVDESQLEEYLLKAGAVTNGKSVVVSKFIENAKEIDLDAVARKGELACWAISEHVENAGVHSGDATLVLPPQRTYLETLRRIRLITTQIAKALAIDGPFNIQFMAKDNNIMVIECNLRASRSFPFVSKVLKYNFIDAAIRVMLKQPVSPMPHSPLDLDYVGVKAPQFSFTRLTGADPVLGVEMASTGEVACLGWDFEEAFLKAMISVGFRFPLKNILLSSGPIESKAALLASVRCFQSLGVHFYATAGTAAFLQENGIETSVVAWPLDQRPNDAVFLISRRKVDLVINIPKNYQRAELTNDYLIRRAAADYDIPLITNVQQVQRLSQALERIPLDTLSVRSWSSYLSREA